MSVKLLTLVVPTYNMERYISRCLDTVTDERIPNTLEVIVVNDGSKDRSLEIMRTYENKRPDIIKIVDKKNGHYGSCVNVGLQQATGKYFRMLDADDWVDTDTLIELLKKLENCDTDLFITLRTEFKVDKEGIGKNYRYPFEKIQYDHIYKMQEFDIASYVKGREFNMHSMAYKTEILRSVGLKHIEGICYTDIQYCFLPIDRIKDFVVFDLYLYYYFIGRDDQSTSFMSLKNNFFHITKVLNFILDYLEAYPSSNGVTIRNQHYFLLEVFEMFLISLRWQDKLDKNRYQLVEQILRRTENQQIKSRLFDKYYFKIWRRWKSRFVLNLVLSIYQAVHSRKH